MKLKYKEDPKEWRKSALMTALGLAVISSLLRWRNILPVNTWFAGLTVLAIAGICAFVQPRWFRGYYRVSLWLGFTTSRFIGRVVLFILFLLIVIPLGLALQWAGKDPLQLKRPHGATTYWHKAKSSNPLDSLF